MLFYLTTFDRDRAISRLQVCTVIITSSLHHCTLLHHHYITVHYYIIIMSPPIDMRGTESTVAGAPGCSYSNNSDTTLFRESCYTLRLWTAANDYIPGNLRCIRLVVPNKSGALFGKDRFPASILLPSLSHTPSLPHSSHPHTLPPLRNSSRSSLPASLLRR